MGRRRRSQVLFVVLSLIALSWITLELGTAARATAGPGRAALTAFGPVQRLVAAITRPATGVVAWVGDQRRLHDRLDALRSANADLRTARVANAELAAENAGLRALLAMRARTGRRVVGARVIGRPPGDPAGGVLITAGAAQGLAPDMPVLAHQGLVGRIVEVTGALARVELVTNPTARYAVRTVTGPPGRLRGGGDGMLRLELNEARTAVAAGTAVVTRAYEGSSIPDGLPVGWVAASVGPGEEAPVRPAARTAALDLVAVIVDGAVAVPAWPADPRTTNDTPLPRPPQPGER